MKKRLFLGLALIVLAVAVFAPINYPHSECRELANTSFSRPDQSQAAEILHKLAPRAAAHRYCAIYGFGDWDGWHRSILDIGPGNPQDIARTLHWHAGNHACVQLASLVHRAFASATHLTSAWTQTGLNICDTGFNAHTIVVANDGSLYYVYADNSELIR